MTTTDKCPQCNKKIDLDKPQTFFQKWKNKKAKQYADKMMGGMPKDMPEFKNYYCDCGLHMTLIKDNKGKWKWITAS